MVLRQLRTAQRYLNVAFRNNIHIGIGIRGSLTKQLHHQVVIRESCLNNFKITNLSVRLNAATCQLTAEALPSPLEVLCWMMMGTSHVQANMVMMTPFISHNAFMSTVSISVLNVYTVNEFLKSKFPVLRVDTGDWGVNGGASFVHLIILYYTK